MKRVLLTAAMSMSFSVFAAKTTVVPTTEKTVSQPEAADAKVEEVKKEEEAKKKDAASTQTQPEVENHAG